MGRAAQAQAALAALSGASADEIASVLREFDVRDIAAAMAAGGVGGGSGGSGISLLGPFDVTFETAGVTDPDDYGAIVGPVLAVGSAVVAAWFAVTTPWELLDNIGNVDGMFVTADPSGQLLTQLVSISPADVVPSWPASAAVDNPRSYFVRGASQQMAVAVYSDDGNRTFTAGEASIYALVVV